jgi:hypothetical protein
MLPGGTCATAELTQRHRNELEATASHPRGRGYVAVHQLQPEVKAGISRRGIAIYGLRAVLNVAMLLRDRVC